MVRKYRNARLDFEFDYNIEEYTELHDRLNYSEDIDIHVLRRVALWKIDRVLSISEETISLLRKIATQEDLSVDDPIVEKTFEALVNCQGVGYPMASTILKFLRPEIFPIIDKRALRALTGVKRSDAYYNFKRYKSYVESLEKIAEDQGLELWEIDEQLYCYDEYYNGNLK